MSISRAKRETNQFEARMQRERGDLVRKAVDRMADQMEDRAARIPDQQTAIALMTKAHGLRSADVMADLTRRHNLRQRKATCDLATDHGIEQHTALSQEIKDLEGQYPDAEFLTYVDHFLSGECVPADYEHSLAVLQVARAIAVQRAKR